MNKATLKRKTSNQGWLTVLQVRSIIIKVGSMASVQADMVLGNLTVLHLSQVAELSPAGGQEEESMGILPSQPTTISDPVRHARPAARKLS